MKFVSLKIVNATQNIGIPVDRIDAVAFSSSNERQVDGNCGSSCVGACKQRVLPDQHPALDRPFTFIVVDGDIWIFEKSSECEPVPHRVIDSFHEFMRGVKSGFCCIDDFPEPFYQRFRLLAPDRESVQGTLVFYLPLYLIQLSVNIEDASSKFLVSKLCFEILSSRMSTTAGFRSGAITEQCIKAIGGISLNDAVKFSKELAVSFEGQIWRIIKHRNFVIGIADVSGDFAFSDVVLVLAVLDFYRGVISLDDVGFEKLFFQLLVQQGECASSVLHPVALGRARNDNIVTQENFLLTVIWQAIIELANDYLCQEARTDVAAGNRRARLFGRQYVLLAFWAGSRFLAVVENFEGRTYHLQLMGDQVTNEFCLHLARWAYALFGWNFMYNRFMGQVFSVVKDGFAARGLCRAGQVITRLGGFSFRLLWCRAWIVLLSLLAVLPFVALLRLRNQHVKLCLQVLEQVSQFCVCIVRLLNLQLQGFDDSNEPLNFRLRLAISALPIF